MLNKVMQSCPQRIPTSVPQHKEPEELDGFENEPDELDVLGELGVDVDDEGTDLDFGVTISETNDTHNDDAAATELDLGELLRPEPESVALSDDENGPIGLDHDVGIESSSEDAEVSDEEGAHEPEFTVDESSLPALDADDMDHDSPHTELDTELVSSDRDEERPPHALKLWYEERPLLPTENCTALLADRGTIIAASSDFFWFGPGREPRESVPGDDVGIAALAVCGPDTSQVLGVTREGKLLRRARGGSRPENLRAARDLGDEHARAHVVDLAELSKGEVLLALLSNGSVARSVDAGESFHSAECPGKVSALAGAGQRAYALSSVDGTLMLLHSDAAGRTWERVPLDATLAATINSTPTLLAGSGPIVALAPRGRSIWISSDGGLHFAKVKGTADTTAICAGAMGERGCVWAALYRESADASDLIIVDAVLAEPLCIAEFESMSADEDLDPADQLEQARVQRLAWDSSTERLWTAGPFGLRGFLPPRAHDS
jgi:hypothetical protein